MGEGVLSDVVPELFILYRLLEMKIHRSDLVPVTTLAVPVPSNNIKLAYTRVTRSDLIATFKIINGNYDIDTDIFF